MVARSLPPQPALPGKAARPLRHLRRRTRTPLLHPAPSSNPVAEVLELGMLAGDAGPLPHTPDCRPLAGDATSQAGAQPQEERSEYFVPASCSAGDLKRMAVAVAMAMEEVEVPIPTEKLSTDPNLDGGRLGGVVLVATGSFNPPTYMHRHVRYRACKR